MEMESVNKLYMPTNDNPLPHCWHRADQNSMSFPPTQRHICCYCGFLTTLHMRKSPGCGEFAPLDNWEVLPRGECPRRGVIDVNSPTKIVATTSGVVESKS